MINKRWLMAVITALAIVCMATGCGAAPTANVNANAKQTTAYLLKQGEVFQPGAYIDVSGVRISYNGNFNFTATNNSNDVYTLVPFIVGVKKDGTHDVLQSISFGGENTEQYAKDKASNGWAVSKWTNRIMPGKAMSAKINALNVGKDYPKPDIDGDGYYDLIFMASRQSDEISMDKNTESAVYRLPVKG